MANRRSGGNSQPDPKWDGISRRCVTLETTAVYGPEPVRAQNSLLTAGGALAPWTSPLVPHHEMTRTAAPVVRSGEFDVAVAAAGVDDLVRELTSVTPPSDPSSPSSPAHPPAHGSGAPDALRSEAAAAVAHARETLGEPEPMTLLRQEGALRVMGWTLGRGRAECREAGQLAHIVGIDVVLIGDGRYAVCERTATDGEDGMSRLDAQCALFDSPTAVRMYCQQSDGDATREAARMAALDHATRRWSPFRGNASRRGRISLPFTLD